MKKKTAVIILCVVVALVALALPKLRPSEKSAGNAARPASGRGGVMTVRTEIIRPERVHDRIVTVGTILPNEEVEIRSEISGKIEKIYFDEGSRAHKGDVLIKINDEELQAQLLRAKSRETLAEQQRARAQDMLQQNLLSQEEYDRAATDLDVAKAEAQLIAAQVGKATIRAPFGGVIGLRYVSDGSYITPATRIATLQDDHQVKIDFSIPEKYAGIIQEGDKISFTTPGAPAPFGGMVYARESKIDAATRTLRIRALSPNPEGALTAGAFANVEVVLEERDALVIPSYALVPELKGQKIFLLRGGKAVPQNVEIGVRTEDKLEISGAVQAGDTLITSGMLQLRPGMTVRPAEEKPVEEKSAERGPAEQKTAQ
jgi:membrane fusion protein (multidrug efflux system)